MRYVSNFLKFWYHFIVGDDYRIALAVIIGLTGIAYLVHAVHLNPWWLLPVVVAAMLSLSLWLEARHV